jgi:outer membrane murein-binding lipoprotein Lpp
VKVTRGAYSATQTISITTTGQLFTITLSISPIGQIPGFPPESIAAGIMIGVAMLLLLGRRRRAQTQKASSDVQQLGTDTQTTDSNLQQLGSDTQTADSDLQALGADAQATQSNMTDLGTGMTSVGMAVDDTVGVR